MSSSVAVISLAVGALAVLYFCINNTRGQRGTKKPLQKLPLIGDLHQSPIEKPLVNWSAWSKDHGSITVSRLFGIVPIVVLNSYEAVTELFNRRSQWYSNRPASVSMEMITGAKPGRSRFTLMHDYDDHLKLHHRVLSPSLGALAASQFQPLMELEAKQLLFDLITAIEKSTDGSTISTKTIYPLLERTQSSVILALHYGIRIPTLEEPILHEVIDIQAKVTHLAANPQLPDLMPFLRHLPAFLSPWQGPADRLYTSQVDLYIRLLRCGRDAPGWNATKQATATAAKHAPADSPVSDLDLAFTLATSIQGGMETSPRQMLWLFVAAVHNPGFMTRAHEVLDQGVGRGRLPRFSDRNSLAYIDAVMHELFRWRPISPGSIPRRADREDEFAGVKIRKGVTVMANAWAISRDEKVFNPSLGDVEDFVPERWLHDGKICGNLPLPVFGQGRRICQGKRVATDGTFMNIANLLWAFDIEAVEGEELDPWAMMVVGFMTEPRLFKFRLKPRGQWVHEVVQKEWASAEMSLERLMGLAHDVEK
ncbi:cytochrome P450 [Didymella exigua CBS 183.55]|uniref:Cytochrome P450 n=1 Tax=Didymella exigua CBS 183.55 TaxID=1150837 RepID=A0A6A5RVX9_9PLEO|nr:cytochrome P450 [Didymella exigua CBS 183.55]KAF1930436.1 cytochrome P450 [Didymella exigua CBS 183.55]